MDKQGLKLVFLYQKYLLLAEILFAEHTLSEEIILNEVSLEGSFTINFALLLSNTDWPEAPRFVGDARGVTDAVISCYRNGTAPLL